MEYENTNQASRRVNSNINPGAGKLQPQSLDIEEAILGALMIEKNAIYEVIDLIKPEMFYSNQHQLIYKAIYALYSKRKPIDILTIRNQLSSTGELEMIGGAYYITELTNRVSGSSNIEFWCRIIMQKYLQREIIRSCTENINNAFEDTTDVFDILGQMSKFIGEAELGFIGSSEKLISDIAIEAAANRMSMPKNDNTIHGLESGITELDILLDGFKPGELIVVGARPAMGKTAVICSISKNINIDSKEPLAVFSLEMSYKQIYLRLQSNLSGISGKKIAHNDLSDEENALLDYTDGQLSNGTMIIDDASFITVSKLVSRLRMYVRKYGIKAAVIDYLGLIHGEGTKQGNREAEISFMTRSLKVAAGELGIPIILLSQLSREVEKRRPLCLPQLSDLRDSGAIEQDADKILFLWRPEYYGVTEPTVFRMYGKTIDNKNLLVYIVAKHREGELGNVPALFTPWNMRIINHPDLIEASLPKTINPLNQHEQLSIPNITPPNYSDNPDDDETPF